ncbi:MAG: acyl-ACP--UDP-N-acetylglucosamine O-acyltransferase [Ignavibacteriae bacterium]|nr:acyl-ACP--UDP-N-acetylglucosamine O-acyltransferase [Ignavibacteriota bacterium]
MNTVSKKAKIGNNVIIGDYTVIKDDVVIGDNVDISSNVLIDNGARISSGVKLHHGAVISSIPQDLKFRGEVTTLEIGEGTVVREYATLNRGTSYSNKTIIGKNCLIMAYAHVAHDCILGDHVIMANSANLGGHVEIGDWAVIGGMTGVHQFSKIGKHVIIATNSRVSKDVPPYITAGNQPLKFEGLNLIGLRRRGFTNGQINSIDSVYNTLYKSGKNITQALEELKKQKNLTEEAKVIVEFVSASTRGIIQD